mmetsp:Transcript_34449/g.82641  ORF Transcript_34449/g.82641 Transcript_34449/m.82641 type:complete len:269 (-) Transcript_34449:108-914(-)
MALEGGSRQEAFINKEAYEEWQGKVVAAFYEEGSRCTELFPQTGAPSVLRKRKFILYALEDTGRTASLVELKSEDLPEKTSLMMYHVGSQTLDFVSRGLKEGVFSHPACDLGGLSNYKQKLGEAADFTGEPLRIQKDCNLSEQSKAICRQWEALAQVQLPENFEADLQTWLATAVIALGGDIQLRFRALPEEHRVVATVADVRAKTGKYYTRVFNGGDDRYAEESTATDLFCAVASKIITPNLNSKNLRTEYCPYIRTPSPAKGEQGS